MSSLDTDLTTPPLVPAYREGDTSTTSSMTLPAAGSFSGKRKDFVVDFDDSRAAEGSQTLSTIRGLRRSVNFQIHTGSLFRLYRLTVPVNTGSLFRLYRLTVPVNTGSLFRFRSKITCKKALFGEEFSTSLYYKLLYCLSCSKDNFVLRERIHV